MLQSIYNLFRPILAPIVKYVVIPSFLFGVFLMSLVMLLVN